MTNTVLRWVSARNLPAENRKKINFKKTNKQNDKQTKYDEGWGF